MTRLEELHKIYEEQEAIKNAKGWVFDQPPPIGVWVYVWPVGTMRFGLQGRYNGGTGYGCWDIEGAQECDERCVKAWRYK